MEARKIDLSPYPVLADGPEGPESVSVSYEVRKSLVNLLFNPQLQLGGCALLEQHELAVKIMDCAEDAILLDQSDYEKLRHATETFRGFGKNEVELVRRVLKAPSVPVAEAS